MRILGSKPGDAPVFDAYLIVDWSANSTPKIGADSIWLCLLERHRRALHRRALANPATRAGATALVAVWLGELAARARRVLAGWDFPFGYPAGFAAMLGAGDGQALWSTMRDPIADADDNANNRFAAAAALNRRATGGASPFWGGNERQVGRYLVPRRRRPPRVRDPRGKRLVDARARTAQSPWKLSGIGSVGSQALLGLPRVHALRSHPDLAGVSRIWPFETGLAALDRRAHDGTRIVHAEVYPSLVPLPDDASLVKDARQVIAAAHHFADLDAHGVLAPAFAGPADAAPDTHRRIEREEAWILGLA